MSSNDKGRATRHNPTGFLPERLRAAAPYLGTVDAELMEEAATALDGRDEVAEAGEAVLLPPPPPLPREHDCHDHLPEVRFWSRVGYPDGRSLDQPRLLAWGTIGLCPCGRAWAVRGYLDPWTPRAWRPIRWWHRELRARVEAYQAAEHTELFHLPG